MAGNNDAPAGSNPNLTLTVLHRLGELRLDEVENGYSKEQVDRVFTSLAELADEVDRLNARAEDAERRAASAERRALELEQAPVAASLPEPTPEDFDQTVSKTLLLAQHTADSLVRDATEEAERKRSEADADARTLRTEAESDAQRLRDEADAIRRDAERDAAARVEAMVDEARLALTSKIEAAEAELVDAHDATRQGLVDEIAEATARRDALIADVERFEGHLAARRETIREALADLTAVVEDPERLRTAMPPAAAPVADGPMDATTQIRVESVDTLAAGVMPLPAEPTAAAATPAEPTAAATTDESSSGPEAAATEPVAADSGSAAVIDLDQAGMDAPVAEGPATEAMDVIDLDRDEALARPAWADSIPVADTPPAPTAGDIVPGTDYTDLTDDDPEASEQLAAFLEGDDEPERSGGGWFSRRR